MTDGSRLDTMIAGTQLSIVGLAIAQFITAELGLIVLVLESLVTAATWAGGRP